MEWEIGKPWPVNEQLGATSGVGAILRCEGVPVRLRRLTKRPRRAEKVRRTAPCYVEPDVTSLVATGDPRASQACVARQG